MDCLDTFPHRLLHREQARGAAGQTKCVDIRLIQYTFLHSGRWLVRAVDGAAVRGHGRQARLRAYVSLSLSYSKR